MNHPLLDADRLTRLGRVSAVAPSPCGTWLAVAVARLDAGESAYISDIWHVSLSDPDQAPVQLTWTDNNDTSPRFRADGALGFLRKPRPSPGEREAGHAQVWLLPAAGGEPRPITDEPLGVRDFRFPRTGARLFVIADVLPGVPHEEQRARAQELARRGPSGLHYTAMPVRHWDHWLPVAVPHVIVIDGAVRRDLTPAAEREHQDMEMGAMAWDVAPDGSRVVVGTLRAAPDRDLDSALRLIEVDRAMNGDADRGVAVDLGVADGATHTMPRFAPDGRRVACVRAVRRPGHAEAMTLWLFDVDGAGGADRQGRALAPDWDVWPALHGWAPDGAAVIATADHGAQVPVFRVDASSGEVTRLSAEAAGGSHGGVHVIAGGAALVGIRHCLAHPPEPFRMDLRAGAEPTLLAGLSGFTAEDGAAVATWESFTVEGDGGVDVQSYLVLPKDRPGPHPVLLWIHGGPMGQHTDGWHWRWNALVAASAGYAVVLPNPRGSTGRGQAFIQGVWNNEWGGACYRDLMAVTDAICARDELDGDRIGAMGGSFGGYMANWIGGNTDRFRCLMTHAGVFHMPAFSAGTDHPNYFYYMMQGTPYSDPEAFDRYSPHRQLERWKTPTLVIHGEKDYRVPIAEALMLFEALQTRGVDSELLVFPDENHWILRPQNIRQWYGAVLAFADRHLGRA